MNFTQQPRTCACDARCELSSCAGGNEHHEMCWDGIVTRYDADCPCCQDTMLEIRWTHPEVTHEPKL